MKLRHLIFIVGVFLLNSCIVKSLNPFYTEDKIISDLRLEGKWQSKGGFWEITSFTEMWEEHNKSEEITEVIKQCMNALSNLIL